ncbi:MAG: hypothetical protein GX622_04425 [Bacteroidales bacterium]|nr:hypothetical protein [Bacteroidales bacterium]
MKINFLAEIPLNRQEKESRKLFADTPDFSIHLRGDDYEFMAWGDPIFDDRFLHSLPLKRNIWFIAENLAGHYFFIFNDFKKNEIAFGTSPFSVPSVYYCVKGNSIILSDNVYTIARHHGFKSVSARFLIETLLFNYPLFNSSLVEGIFLLDSCSALVAGHSSYRIVRHTAPEEWFANDPVSWRKSIPVMTDIFLSAIEKYLPKEHYLTALTGGFDSRTLAAAGLFHGRTFSGYCFGSAMEGDLCIAAEISSKAEIPFTAVLLDGDYVRHDSLEAGKEFIVSSSGTGTFSRAHYIHAASLLGREARYLITGNFGSEVLRAVHSPGVMISPLLYQAFQARGPEQVMASLKRNPLIRFIAGDAVENELRRIEEDISGLPCFDQRYLGLGRNMQLYLFIFEETFRKYFGSEIAGQWNRLINRTPFLDRHFLKELLSTGLAGVHSRFMERLPGRRYKGQILYASVINRAAPQFGTYVTDKGYRPDDLLTLTGKARMLTGWLKKRVSGGMHSPADPMAVHEAWKHNRAWYESLPVGDDLFNKREIDQLRGPGFSNEKARLYSLIFAADYLRHL